VTVIRSARESDDFADHLVGVVNSSMLALMISVGLRTGLFDAMESLPSSTSAEVATAAGLDERYVREWLAALTTGGVVAHDPVNMTFALPPEQASALKRVIGGPGGKRLGALAQHASLLASLKTGSSTASGKGAACPTRPCGRPWVPRVGR
jgi:hypothetical protein